MARYTKLNAVLFFAVLTLAVYSFMETDVASAVGFTPVRVVNPKSDPALTRDVDRPASRPFAKNLCLTDITGACDGPPTLPASFVVPAATNTGEPVKQLIIEFVSGTCVGTGRATFVEIASRPSGSLVVSDDGDNFTINRLPLAVAQFISAPGINGAQAFAEATRIYLAPGMSVSVSFNAAQAGVVVCRAQLNGHFARN